MVSKSLGVIDNLLQDTLLFGLEREAGNLFVPDHKVFQSWPGRVSRNLDAVVADGACPGFLIIVLDLAPRNLKAFSVIPIEFVSGRWFYWQRKKVHTTHGRCHTRSSCPPQPVGT